MQILKGWVSSVVNNYRVSSGLWLCSMMLTFMVGLSSTVQAFDGEITVLRAKVEGDFGFRWLTNNYQARLPRTGSGYLLNLKYCDSRQSAVESVYKFDCKKVVELAFGSPLLSEFPAVGAYKTNYKDWPIAYDSRDLFKAYSIVVLVKAKTYENPEFKGIGLHKHIVDIDSSYWRPSPNKYGPNSDGSFVNKENLKTEGFVELKNGEYAYVFGFIAAHYYGLGGASKPSRTGEITIRPNAVVGQNIIWDKVEKDYFLSTMNSGAESFDRSAELLRKTVK